MLLSSYVDGHLHKPAEHVSSPWPYSRCQRQCDAIASFLHADSTLLHQNPIGYAASRDRSILLIASFAIFHLDRPWPFSRIVNPDLATVPRDFSSPNTRWSMFLKRAATILSAGGSTETCSRNIYSLHPGLQPTGLDIRRPVRTLFRLRNRFQYPGLMLDSLSKIGRPIDQSVPAGSPTSFPAVFQNFLLNVHQT